ncbi:MAG: hypothetical protein IK065_03290, partial [Neisseriaceae bacterium]|nr:hypothetical protein [Neisseriaceae bacterium]
MKNTQLTVLTLSLVVAFSTTAWADENNVSGSLKGENNANNQEIATPVSQARNDSADVSGSLNNAHSGNATELETITVKANRISAKPVQDFREFEKSNATDLKDVLADEVAVQFGGG